MQWELTAANLGSNETVKEVGDIHYHREDYEYAVAWYQIAAADHGNDEAQYKLRALGKWRKSY